MTGTGQNPTHTYEQPGNYTVSLTLKTGNTTITVTKENYIKVSELTGGCLSEVPFEVRRERLTGKFDTKWQATNLSVHLEKWDRVEMTVTFHSAFSKVEIGLLAPGNLERVLAKVSVRNTPAVVGKGVLRAEADGLVVVL